MRAAAAVLAVAMACSAVANDLPGKHGDTAGHDAPSFEEIIVTAERRDAPARKVPVSMTAVTPGQIAARQLRDVASLRHVAPSLESAPAQGNSETANIGMRGHVETDNAPSVDPAVGLFLDGVYLARATGANLRLFDVTRVEIIRGPQGTLFGRNTIGGAINIIPAKPSDRFEAALGLEVGNFDARAFSGVFNTPLGNSAAVRVAARRSVRNGFASSIPLERDLGDDDTNYLRAALRYGRPEGTTFDLSFDLTDIDTGSQWITALDAQPPATLVPAAAGQPQDSLDNYVDPYTNRTWASYAGSFSSLTRGTSASLSAPFGSATVRLTSAFRELVLDIRETDLDGTPYDVATQLRHQQWQSQVSHELQVVGETAGARLDWVGGLYYFEEEADIDALSNNLVPILPGETNSRGQVSNDSFSVFGQLRFRLPRDLRLTAGVRRTFDGRQLTSTNARLRDGVEICAIIPEILDDPGECRATLPEKRFAYTPFAVALDYGASADVMFYGKYSRGFRAGGYNSRLTTTTATLPFEPERVDTLEFGAKAAFDDAGLRVALAIYRSHYDDIQLPTVVPLSSGGVSIVTRNAGSARIDGGEVELEALLGPLRLGAGLGLTDAHYVSIDDDVLELGTETEFRMTPPRTFTMYARLPFVVSQWNLNLDADYAWRDEVVYGGGQAARQGAFGIANARLTFAVEGSELEIGLWVRNLTDRKYLVRAIGTGNGLIKGLPGEPRTYGATLDYRFGGS